MPDRHRRHRLAGLFVGGEQVGGAAPGPTSTQSACPTDHSNADTACGHLVAASPPARYDRPPRHTLASAPAANTTGHRNTPPVAVARRHGCSRRSPTRRPGWPVYSPRRRPSPPARPASVCSVSPGRNSATAAAIPLRRPAPRWHGGDLVGRLDPSRGSHRPLAVDEFGIRECLGNSLAKVGVIASVPTRQAVSMPRRSSSVPRSASSDSRRVRRAGRDRFPRGLPRHPCSSGRSHRCRAHHADRTERPGSADPQLRRPGHSNT